MENNLIKTPKSYVTITISDCDIMGHLNNIKYLEYFINAREEHLWEAYQLRIMDYVKTGIGWVVGSHEIKYLRPVIYYDKVCIRTAVIKIAASELIVESVMMDEQENSLKSILWTTFVPVEVKSGKRAQHPESFMEFAESVVLQNIDFEVGIAGRIKALKMDLKS